MTSSAFLLVGGWTSVAEAGFKLPREVDSLEKLKEAGKGRRGLVPSGGFLCTKTETDCGLCADANLAMVEELDSLAVMVYARYAQRGNWPPELQRT